MEYSMERARHGGYPAAQRHVDGRQHAADGVIQGAAQRIHEPLPIRAVTTLLPVLFSEHRGIRPGSTDDVEDRFLRRNGRSRGEVTAALIDAGEPAPVHLAYDPGPGPGRSHRDYTANARR
jgi:hypothetical protein